MTTETKGHPASITPEQLFAETPNEAYMRAAADTPVLVTMKGREIELRELTLKHASVWEKRANAFFGELANLEGLADTDQGNPEELKKAADSIPLIISVMPEQLADIVIDYVAACSDEVTDEWCRERLTRSDIMYLAKIVFWLGLPTLRGGGFAGIMPSTVEAEITNKGKAKIPSRKV